MRLSHQLMAVSLLMLGLPWAGCQYLRELESALRQGQEQALLASTQAIAASFAHRIHDAEQDIISATGTGTTRFDTNQWERHTAWDGSTDQNSPIYAEVVGWPLIVDGYDNEWQPLPSRRFSDAESYPVSIQLRSAIQGSQLYLYFNVIDDKVRYQNRAHPLFENGDRLILHCGNGQRYVLLSGAPGDLPAYYRRQGEYRLEQAIEAQWQDHSRGYSMEIAIPLRIVQGKLGFSLLDEDDTGSIRSRLGNMDSAYTPQAPPLIYRSPQLHQRLEVFRRDGLQLRLVDPEHWRIAAVGTLESDEPIQSHWFPRWLYRSILSEQQTHYPIPSAIPGQENQLDVNRALSGKTSVSWYQDPTSEQRSILTVAMPIRVDGVVQAALLAEETNERFLGLTDRAFERLLLFGFIAFLLTGIGLISYAAWLSWRIRRLSQATTPMIENHELRLDDFPISRSRDEIGDLTRNFRRLVVRIKHYTEYLQSLSRKLTHELRTPLAVVRTSLDNLHDESVNEDSRVYLQRARDGAARLSQLLTALSEATRMEEAIQNTEQEPVNMAALLDELVTVYRQLHPTKNIQLEGVLPMHLVPSRTIINAAPDLLAQMFDKLIANAVDFTPDGGDIIFHYHEHSRHVLVDIINDGPQLPAKIRHQIFDQLISSRGKKNNKKNNGQQSANETDQQQADISRPVHLGLGLYIVRLIVEYHQGHIRAENRPDKQGVVFSLNLPMIDRKKG